MKRLFAVPFAIVAFAATAAVADHHAAPEAPKASIETVVTNDMPLPADGEWKHSFDAYKAEGGEINASLRRALGLYRAMEKAGVDPAQVRAAVVVHGPSVFDVANDARYAAKYQAENGVGSDADEARAPLANPNAELVADLVARGAEIWVCGVAAAHHGVGNADLLKGVKMAPSGTVAHAELQRRGYGINPY